MCSLDARIWLRPSRRRMSETCPYELTPWRTARSRSRRAVAIALGVVYFFLVWVSSWAGDLLTAAVGAYAAFWVGRALWESWICRPPEISVRASSMSLREGERWFVEWEAAEARGIDEWSLQLELRRYHGQAERGSRGAWKDSVQFSTPEVLESVPLFRSTVPGHLERGSATWLPGHLRRGQASTSTFSTWVLALQGTRRRRPDVVLDYPLRVGTPSR